MARLRLVERLCAAHGEPIGKGENTTRGNAHDGNRTRDDSTREDASARRVWTKADPATVAKPIFYGRDCEDAKMPHGARFIADDGSGKDEGAQAMASIRGTRPRRRDRVRPVPEPHERAKRRGSSSPPLER